MSAINKPYDPARGVRLDNLPPFAQRMREAADLVWEQGYRQPFLRELGEGTLQREKFAFYLLQDYRYLSDYAKVHALALTKTDDTEVMQFINVFDKPVLIYTLESFQRHPDVDAIAVVCIDGWQTMVDAYAKQFNIDKLQWIVPGGGSVRESIRNGVEHLEHELDPEDIVIIHDGIRPLIDADVLTDVIQVCERYGNAVTSLPYNEQIFVINQDDPSTTVQYVPREQLRRVSTPQAYRYGKLLAAYRKAFKENIGIHGSSYTNTMMVDLGETLHFAKGSDKNIKLTTKGDLELFKAYITADEDTWLK